MLSVITILLLSLVYLQGAISEYVFGVSTEVGLTSASYARIMVELSVAGGLVYVLSTQRCRLPAGWKCFALYCAWSILSGVVVDGSPISGALYCRYTLFAFILYFVGVNVRYSRKDLRRIVIAVTLLFAAQIVASVYEFTIGGERTEWRVGAMSISGGELAAIFPLVGLAYAMGYYFYCRPRLWVLFAGLSFAVIGYASGKRAIYFSVPAFFVVNTIVYATVAAKDRRRLVPRRYTAHIFICACAAVPLMIVGVQQSYGLGYVPGATASELLEHAIGYAANYETGQQLDGSTTGRTSASGRVIDSVAVSGLKRALFGWGPDALKPRGGDAIQGGSGFRPLGIVYGIVGWSRDTLSIGLPAVVFYLCAYASIGWIAVRTLLNRAVTKSWHAVAFGTLAAIIAIVYSYVHYSSVTMLNGAVTFVPMLCAGVLSNLRQCVPVPGPFLTAPALPECTTTTRLQHAHPGYQS